MTNVTFRNARSISFESQITRAATTDKNGRKLAERGSKKFRKRFRKEMNRQYGSLLRGIGNVLKSPQSYGLGGTSGGSHQLKRLRAGGARYISVSTPSWAPLTQEYVERSQSEGLRSTQFWNKSKGRTPRRVGLGDRDVSLGTAYNLSVSGRERVYVRPNQLKEVNTGDNGSFRQRFRFVFPDLPSPLDTVITKSFISGELQDPLKKGENMPRNGIGIVAYPEHFRPLLGAISVKFSDRSIQGLQKAANGLNK